MSTEPGSAPAVRGPNKRPRQTEPEEEEPQVQQGLKFRRDHEVWLEDGNIILIANDVAFKVYQGILSRRSEVFRDLFTLPSPPEGEMLDGVPSVRVHDSPDDLRPLLLVLCYGKNYYTRNDLAIPIDFSVLSALVRMSHKYAVPDILDHSIARLRQRYPSTYLSYRYDWGAKLVASRPQPEDAITAIHLARLTDNPQMLPAAFLACLSLPGIVLLKSIGQPTGLAAEDVVTIMEGKAKLVRESALDVLEALKFMAERGDYCRAHIGGNSSESCNDFLEHFLRDKGEEDFLPYLSHNLNGITTEFFDVEGVAGASYLCDQCLKTFKTQLTTSSSRTWCKLPEIFNLSVEGWEVFKE